MIEYFDKCLKLNCKYLKHYDTEIIEFYECEVNERNFEWYMTTKEDVILSKKCIHYNELEKHIVWLKLNE